MEHLALALNLIASPITATQFTNYNYNSLAKFNGRYIGAGDSGLMVLGESADDDAGTNIDAFFELVTTDFGIDNQKRFERLEIGYESDGVLKVTLTPDDNADPWVYYLEPISRDNQQGSNRSGGNRRYMGRYWSVRIDNHNGCDFAIDKIKGLIVRLGGKPPGSKI